MNIEQERADFEVWWDGLPSSMQSLLTYEVATQAYDLGRAAMQSQDREDALRYRWLRNRASTEGICVVHIDYWSEEYRGQAHCEVYDGEFLDKAIDRARRVEGMGNEIAQQL